MTNLGRLVKWQDADRGWHTGREVTLPDGEPLRISVVLEDYVLSLEHLVQESCTYQLSWVPILALTAWETREQRAERGEE